MQPGVSIRGGGDFQAHNCDYAKRRFQLNNKIFYPKIIVVVMLSKLVSLYRITAEGLFLVAKRFLWFFVKNSHFESYFARF